MRAEGFEPPQLTPPEPKSGVSTSSTTPASTNPSPRAQTDVGQTRGAPSADWHIRQAGDDRTRPSTPNASHRFVCKASKYRPVTVRAA